MTDFASALASGRFLVTTEEPPPKGTDLRPLASRTRLLLGTVDGINITESSNAVMTMSPLGVVPVLLAQGHHPILQILGRDRNRLAIQGDLLAASSLGVSTVVAMAGDPIDGGDDAEARSVFDLDTPSLLRAAASLNDGRDLAAHALKGAPRFCLGAVVNPGASNLDAEIRRMEDKAEAGAQFFQTQAVYDIALFERFMTRAARFDVPVLAGHIVLKSAEMGRRLNETLPGVQVPSEVLRQLDQADDKAARSIELSAHILRSLRTLCQGLHIIAVGWEALLPELLQASGIDRTSA